MVVCCGLLRFKKNVSKGPKLYNLRRVLTHQLYWKLPFVFECYKLKKAVEVSCNFFHNIPMIDVVSSNFTFLGHNPKGPSRLPSCNIIDNTRILICIFMKTFIMLRSYSCKPEGTYQSIHGLFVLWNKLCKLSP